MPDIQDEKIDGRFQGGIDDSDDSLRISFNADVPGTTELWYGSK
jgi:hypothetical protein